MNPAVWPWWWTFLVGGVFGFGAGVVTSGGMAARLAARALRELDGTRTARVRKEMERAKRDAEDAPKSQ